MNSSIAAIAAASIATWAPGVLAADGNPCRAAIEPLLAQAEEIRNAYALAEAGGERREACTLAGFHVQNIERIIAALAAMPPSCAPPGVGLQRQLQTRERIVWLARAQRQCEPGSMPNGGRQHRIIKVE